MRQTILMLAAGMLACVLLLATLQASPPPSTGRALRPPKPAAASPEIVTVLAPNAPGDQTPRNFTLHNLNGFRVAGVAQPGDRPGERFLRLTHTHEWRPDYPVCRVGMIIPICGRVGTIISVRDEVRIQMLPEAELPPGVVPPGVRDPLVLGGARELGIFARLEISRIGRDAAGALSVDLKQRWRTGPDEPDVQAASTGLAVGSQFTLEEHDSRIDYRIEQIVAPDEERHVVGWITVAPLVDTFRWREHKAELLNRPDEITVPHWKPGTPAEYEPLRTFRTDVQFVGLSFPERNGSRVVRIGIEQPWFRKAETWGYTSPPLYEGLLLPVCGRLARVESFAEGMVVFRTLADADVPSGVTAPAENFPIILGATRGDLSLSGIRTDDAGALVADVEQKWKEIGERRMHTRREMFQDLKVGSTFTRRLSNHLVEYRVTQIVAPDAKHRVPGWITVRPVPSTRTWRPDGIHVAPITNAIPDDA